MKALTKTHISLTNNHTVTQPCMKVCMHVLGKARNDARVMRSATALTEAGFDVSIVDIESERNLAIEENLRGVCLQHIIMPGWFIYSIHFDPWFLVRAIVMLIRSLLLLLRTQADIYHAHDVMALPACFIAARLRRKLLIFDAHELPLSDLSARWIGLKSLSKGFLNYVVPRCDGVITVSPPIVREIRSRYQCREISLIRNIPEYQAVPKNDLLRQRLGLGPNIRIVLYQGALQADRGLDTLIRSAVFLEKDIMIVLMGRAIRDTQAILETLILHENVADRVKILPPVPYTELLDWTASANIGLVVLPPNYSLNIQMCLPNKLFEYMMVGIPILASQLDSVVEVIKTYDVGQVVPSLAPRDVAAAINAMLADHQALARMHNNALEASTYEFNWEKESQKLLDLYRDILPNSPNDQ